MNQKGEREKPVKDPVCQMAVDQAKAAKMTHKGKMYYFCSPTCQWAFESNPEQFIKK